MNSIFVTNLEDLFWNNNSDLYPTTVPETTLYEEIPDTKPTFFTPYIGTCIIQGEYNHCIYNGNYYLLTKIEVQDIETETYKYQLDYDMMINFLNRGGQISGILTKTNREEILEGCLQTTKAILADPVRVIYKNFESKSKM